MRGLNARFDFDEKVNIAVGSGVASSDWAEHPHLAYPPPARNRVDLRREPTELFQVHCAAILNSQRRMATMGWRTATPVADGAKPQGGRGCVVSRRSRIGPSTAA